MHATSIALITSVLAIAAGAPAAAAPRLEQGDLLVTDYGGGSVLHVDPDTGNVRSFSPRAGSGPNLLVGPWGIAIDPGGAVLVVSYFTGQLISIDPTTGVQTQVQAIDSFDPVPTAHALDLGTHPAGIAISEFPDENAARDVFVGAHHDDDFGVFGRLYRVERDILGVRSVPLVSSELLLNPFGLALVESGVGAPDSIYLATASGLVSYLPAIGTLTDVYPGGADGPYINDVAVGEIVAFSRKHLCGDPDNGVYRPAFEPILLASLSCPTGIDFAVDGSGDLYVADLVDDNGSSARVVRLSDDGSSWTESLIAELPNRVPFGIAVSPITFAPEPGHSAGAALALAALALLRLRVAWAARSRKTSRRRSGVAYASCRAGRRHRGQRSPVITARAARAASACGGSGITKETSSAYASL
jgi:hypothetical protein